MAVSQAATQAGSEDSLPSRAVSSPSDLVGIPWARHGMDPAEGLGCWGVVWYAAKYYGYEFPRFEQRLETVCDHLDVARDRFKELFDEVQDAQAGDVVMFSVRANGLCDHIGIMIDSVRFLHSYPNGGVCISRLNSPVYRKRIAGIYRWQKHGT